MKQEIITKLEEFRTDLLDLRKQVSEIPGKTVNRVGIQRAADVIATKWVEDLRIPLECKFRLPESTIHSTSEHMKRLHILSRPSNLKKSYLETINAVLSKFDNKFILPIKQSAFTVETVLDLQKLIPNLPDPSESEYLQEAINCANWGFKRGSIVLGWCAAIDRIQRILLKKGLDKFNIASKQIKSQTSGKFKNWNKEFSLSTLSDLQTVFDNDLIVVLEGMEMIDGNQAERLRTCFQYRNHSAHPGSAPIEDPHLVVFFGDINSIIFQNPIFKV